MRRSNSRRATKACKALFTSIAALAVGAALLPPARAQVVSADHHLRATPENVSWGWFPIDKAPILSIASGDTVSIDTISHHGSTQDEDPVTFLAEFGVAPDEILDDVRTFWASRPDRPREGRTGVHVLTGPIAIEGAEPGDMLEVQVLEVTSRVPYGFNTRAARGGPLGDDYPGTEPGDRGADIAPGGRRIVRTAEADGRIVALIADGLRVPLAPFQGIMAVAPEAPTVGQPGVTVAGIQSSRQPGPYGGNLDIKQLTAGATLYLPVFHDGALFYTGDPHGVQGDGEVSGTALEQSNTAVFRFVLHKNVGIVGPRAETPTHYVAIGIDLDLDRAMRKALLAAIEYLGDEHGIAAADAFTLASLGIDFAVAEAVNETQVVTALIPKSLFVER
jgi:acetamidase/formamidase